jgi:hypothetical protein
MCWTRPDSYVEDEEKGKKRNREQSRSRSYRIFQSPVPLFTRAELVVSGLTPVCSYLHKTCLLQQLITHQRPRLFLVHPFFSLSLNQVEHRLCTADDQPKALSGSQAHSVSPNRWSIGLSYKSQHRHCHSGTATGHTTLNTPAYVTINMASGTTASSLALLLLLSCAAVSRAARRLEEEATPKEGEPHLTVPDLPVPEHELPPLPKVEMPPFPEVELPPLPKVELPPFPEVELPPKPELPAIPGFHFPEPTTP